MQTAGELPEKVSFERFGGSQASLTRLTKESVRPNDVLRIAEICNQPKVKKWVTYAYATGQNGEYTKQDARQYIGLCAERWHQNTTFVYSVRNSQNEIVGNVSIKSPDKEGAEIGYWADTKQRGYMTNAISALCELAKKAGYNNLFANVEPDNQASINVVKKNDFVNKGLIVIQHGGRKTKVLKFAKNLNAKS